MVEVNIPGGYGIPLANLTTGLLPTPTMDALAAEVTPTVRTSIIQSANTFTEAQTFDPIAGVHIGDKLSLSFTDGFFGQRLHLTGLPQAVGEDDIMPYFEIAPTTMTGTDVGGAIAGYQLYRTPGGGGVANREFLAIEASGDLATVPGFKISPWASGTGSLRPITVWDGTHEVFRVVNEGGTGALRLGDSSRFTILDVGTTARTVILMQRQGTFSDQRRVYSSTGATRAYLFFSKNRGTIDTPTPPGSGDTLGEVSFGSVSSGTEKISSYVRSLTKQAWTYDSAQGSKVAIAVTPTGAASVQIQAEFDDPSTDEAGVLLRVDRSGVKTLSRVSIGVADSGGAGFRVLRVAN